MTSKITVILQARTGSKRLYGKVLLPICNHELVILCWKRIKMSGLKTIVAIPKKNEDDYLAQVLKKNGANFFRGESNNVLSRFKKISSNMNPEDILVRVTADNPVVDGFFIKQLISVFNRQRFEYFSAHDNLKSVPYGLQTELFKVKHLRESLSKDKFNLEHVTPNIRKKYLSKKKINIKSLKGLSNLQISIDNIHDFQRVKKIFSVFNNNYRINYLKLLTKFKKLSKQKEESFSKKSKYVLGTVQLGKKYFNNESITQQRANKILNFATKNGINFLDTAHDYGKAEKFIGNFCSKKKKTFHISTKLKNFLLKKNQPKNLIVNNVNESIFNSLKNLNTNVLDTYLVHDPKLLFRSKIVYNQLIRFLNCGIIKNIGASIYTPQEYYKLKKFKKISCVQIPFNLLDYRWVNILSRKQNKIKIFVRSIFLRGNIKKNRIKFPVFRKKYDYLISNLNKFNKEFGKRDLLELSISYVKAFKGINYFIFGVQQKSDFVGILKYLKTDSLKKMETKKVILTVKNYFNSQNADLRSWN